MAFFCSGPRIPEDLKPASGETLATKLQAATGQTRKHGEKILGRDEPADALGRDAEFQRHHWRHDRGRDHGHRGERLYCKRDSQRQDHALHAALSVA